ncbi:conserved hypothetical protein [Theileria equi strain WA]|uniref:Uncharacterized protein n=1 Tax=Theileria equi strain WA TaxID=1537102 RepID=L1LE46_THEEQ|nr:conserved hypothetical protein [Theileria equi strain WA]EKX73428.1 conserved hypothetical protein [Theileria equi strain WA]|eukprot:XP_004832880.1 conserved hypothetical protein [Theileria equi strain WA]
MTNEYSVTRWNIDEMERKYPNNPLMSRHLLHKNAIYKMCQVYDTLNRSFKDILIVDTCRTLQIDIDEYKTSSLNLLTHLPKPYEMSTMDSSPNLWSDLFHTEVSMLCNTKLLDESIEIANKLKKWALKMVKNGMTVEDTMHSSVDSFDGPIHDINCIETMEFTIAHVLNNVYVYNARLSDAPREQREYYDYVTRSLFYIKEEQLLTRVDAVEKERGNVLLFLRQLSKIFDIDKCTHNLAILYFDTYITRSINEGSITALELDYKTLLKIATAAYLLAAALREHWIDISRDTYLEHAVNRSLNAFQAHDVVMVQLDILQTMPKGFTNIYVTMEYGLFYLANIRGAANWPQESGDSSSSVYGLSNTRSIDTEYLDTPTFDVDNTGCLDYLLLNTAFSYIVENGSFIWLYQCLSRWDDVYIAKNWNRFTPPSRAAAVLIFHLFVNFYNIDPEVHLEWCRRFSFKIFRMYYDCDLALWYKVFKDRIAIFLRNIEQSSQRLHEMATLFKLASHKFRAAEALLYVFWTRSILPIWEFGYQLQDLDLEGAKNKLSNIMDIIIET